MFSLPKEVDLHLVASWEDPCYQYAAGEIRRILERLGTQSNVRNSGNSGKEWTLGITAKGHGEVRTKKMRLTIAWDGYSISITDEKVVISALLQRGF